MMEKRRATSVDVAREAGVSQSTVSRVFNESGIPVSEKKRRLVVDTAEKLGYRPSQIARSLNSQSTKIIGFVLREFEKSFYTHVLKLLTQRIQQHGYILMLFYVEDDNEVEDNLKKALEYQVAGLIISSATLSSALVEGCVRYKTPVFLFNRISEGLNVNTVCCDNIDGGEAVAKYLIERGHDKLVYVSGEEMSSTNRDRMRGFMNEVNKRGLEEVTVIPGDFSYQAGFQAAEKLMKEGIVFDGVFCASDETALGFMDYIQYHSDLRIPDDISIVGFDGIDIPNTVHYPLTTFQQPVERMVDKTIEGLIEKIENFSSNASHFLFFGQILERNSVRDRNI